MAKFNNTQVKFYYTNRKKEKEEINCEKIVCNMCMRRKTTNTLRSCIYTNNVRDSYR